MNVADENMLNGNIKKTYNEDKIWWFKRSRYGKRKVQNINDRN